MGLLGSIGKIVGGPIGKIAGGVLGGVLAGKSSKKTQQAIDNSVQAVLQGNREAIAEQQRQFDLSRSDQMPWLDAGEGALGGIMDLLGIAGPGQPSGRVDERQAEAIAALEKSPLFRSLVRNGEEAILANGSATGGLRGGNIQDTLANFRSDALSQVIQQQLANLGGLSGTGVGSAQSLGALGSGYAGNISGLLAQQGNVMAGGILGKAGVSNQKNNSIGGLIGDVVGGGDVLKGLGGILGGIF